MKKYVFVTLSIVFIGIILLMFLALQLVHFEQTPVSIKEDANLAQEDKKFMTIIFHDTKVYAEVVEQASDRNKGLSGREYLEEGTGMFFVFPKLDKYSFWMQDMHFPIDIIWLDENMNIVFIKENATPDSYPELFTPDVLAQYVLEVPAGFVQKNNIHIGNRAYFQS